MGAMGTRQGPSLLHRRLSDLSSVLLHRRINREPRSRWTACIDSLTPTNPQPPWGPCQEVLCVACGARALLGEGLVEAEGKLEGASAFS